MEQPNVDSFEGLDLKKLPIDTVRYAVVARRQFYDVCRQHKTESFIRKPFSVLSTLAISEVK